MGLVYVGDCTFQETLNSGSFSIDPWGMDVLTRIREGRSDQLDAELNLYGRKRDIRDAAHSGFYFIDLDTQKGRSFTRVTLTFKGLKNGNIPAPVIAESGYRRSTVELSVAEDIGFTVLGNSSTITYNAPYVKVNFVSKKRRRFAQHANLIDAGQLQIIKQKGAQLADLNIVKGQSLNNQPSQTVQQIAGIVGRYNGTMEVQSSITSQKPVGQWWEGTETHEILIVPMEQRVRALAML